MEIPKDYLHYYKNYPQNNITLPPWIPPAVNGYLRANLDKKNQKHSIYAESIEILNKFARREEMRKVYTGLKKHGEYEIIKTIEAATGWFVFVKSKYDRHISKTKAQEKLAKLYMYLKKAEVLANELESGDICFCGKGKRILTKNIESSIETLISSRPHYTGGTAPKKGVKLSTYGKTFYSLGLSNYMNSNYGRYYDEIVSTITCIVFGDESEDKTTIESIRAIRRKYPQFEVDVNFESKTKLILSGADTLIQTLYADDYRNKLVIQDRMFSEMLDNFKNGTT